MPPTGPIVIDWTGATRGHSQAGVARPLRRVRLAAATLIHAALAPGPDPPAE